MNNGSQTNCEYGNYKSQVDDLGVFAHCLAYSLNFDNQTIIKNANYNVHKRDVTRWNMFFNIASAHICTSKMNQIIQDLEKQQNDKGNFF